MSELRCIVDGSTGPLVKRKIVVFRRLEPGDIRTPGTHQLPHSPYLEGKVLDLALSKSFFDDMERVEKKRREILGSGEGSLLHRFDIPGIIIAGAGATLIGSTMGYAPVSLRPVLIGILVVGVVLGFVTRILKSRADAEAEARWKAAPEHKENERLGRELAEAWVRFSSQVKREHEGFHTELRVGEGSTAPQRLCSLDPRGFNAMPPTFDSQDWLPTVGGGVRYEEIDVMGELVTRGLEGVDDWAEDGSPPKAKAEKETKSDAKAGPEESDAKASPEESDDEGDEDGAEKADEKAEPSAPEAKDEQREAAATADGAAKTGDAEERGSADEKAVDTSSDGSAAG